MFSFLGHFYCMFVHCSDSRHCQNGALRTASISTVKNNGICDGVYSCIHWLHYFPQHITPSCPSAVRIWKNGRISVNLCFRTKIQNSLDYAEIIIIQKL